MPAIEKILSDVIIRLDDCTHPTRRELMLFLYEHNQAFVNQMKLTDEGWLLRSFDFDPDGSTNVYPIPAGAYGFNGPYLVTTRPEAYSDYRRREVLTCRKIDVNLTGAASFLLGADGAEPDTLQALAFYGIEGGQYRAETAPFNARGSYVVWYEPGYLGETALKNVPAMLEAWTPLLTVSVALDGLASAQWDGLEGDAAAAKRADLRLRLVELEARRHDTWTNYIASMNQPQQSRRRAFESAPGMANRTRGGRRFIR